MAYENDILTIGISLDDALYASPEVVRHVNDILKDIITKFSVSPEIFVLGGFNMGGTVILRYTEMAVETPANFPVRPKAIFTIDSPTDLIGFWHYCEREIRKNFLDTSVKEAKYFIDRMTKENGTIYNNLTRYVQLSPFTGESHIEGHEKFLRKIPVRLYYDTDINWQLTNKRSGYNDTHMPGGSELVNRLLLEGNQAAEFISSKIPGVRGSGVRHPTSWSIVDEVDCIHWIEEKLKIFDLDSWKSPYKFVAPPTWRAERIQIPLDFAPQIPYAGVEDIRFAPGWGEKDNSNYWSYTFLWWIDGNPPIDDKVLDNDLTAYYSGIVNRNLGPGKTQSVPVSIGVKKVRTLAGDAGTFNATIQMTDYMTAEPIKLNGIIHYRKSVVQNKAIILFEMSPQPVSGPIWKEMRTIGAGVVCD